MLYHDADLPRPLRRPALLTLPRPGTAARPQPAPRHALDHYAHPARKSGFGIEGVSRLSFREHRYGKVRRTYLPPTPVNRGVWHRSSQSYSSTVSIPLSTVVFATPLDPLQR